MAQCCLAAQFYPKILISNICKPKVQGAFISSDWTYRPAAIVLKSPKWISLEWIFSSKWLAKVIMTCLPLTLLQYCEGHSLWVVNIITLYCVIISTELYNKMNIWVVKHSVLGDFVQASLCCGSQSLNLFFFVLFWHWGWKYILFNMLYRPRFWAYNAMYKPKRSSSVNISAEEKVLAVLALVADALNRIHKTSR